MDANELPRVQSLLELAERAIHEMAARRRHGQCALSLRHEVGDLGSLDELGALLAEVHADAIGVGRHASVAVVTREALQDGLYAGGAGIRAPALEAFERALDTLALDRLQEIVDRGSLERLQRVLVEGGDETVSRSSSSNPVIPGMWMSRKSASTASVGISISAVSADVAVPTTSTRPVDFRLCTTCFKAPDSSSTT